MTEKPYPPLWFRLAFFSLIAALTAACISLPASALVWLAMKALDFYGQVDTTPPFFPLWGVACLIFLLGFAPYCLRLALKGNSS